MDYAYDHAGRLLSATNVSNTAYSRTYTYDAGHNMLSKSDIGTYVYPAATAPRPHTPTSAGGTTLTYDANGDKLINWALP